MIESSAVRLDGRGGAEPLVEQGAGAGITWRHLDLNDAAQQTWIRDAGLEQHIATALLAEDSRPRSLIHGDGLLLTLKKEDFIRYVKEPLARELKYPQALAEVEKGSLWLDKTKKSSFKSIIIIGRCG